MPLNTFTPDFSNGTRPELPSRLPRNFRRPIEEFEPLEPGTPGQTPIVLTPSEPSPAPTPESAPVPISGETFRRQGRPEVVSDDLDRFALARRRFGLGFQIP